MANLYGGKILFADLTHNVVRVVPTAHYAPLYIGGRGINARLLYENVDAQTDPLGPENVLLFGTGPLSGTLFPGSSRTDVMCKSPVTGFIGDANMGGNWSAELKHAGWDHVVLQGKAAQPVYLYIRNDKVEIRDARHLWGLDNYAAHRCIREELGSEVKVVGIGPAGENQVTYANVFSSLANPASRTGNGAVMGSKNVKAIAVRGTQGVQVADPEAFFAACVAAQRVVTGSAYYPHVHEVGASDSNTAYVRSGVKWGQTEQFPAWESSWDWAPFWKQYGAGRTGCTGCPVQCMEAYRLPSVGASVISCDLYTAFSAGLANEDLELWFKMVLECHKQGIDEASAAMVIHWLMELWDLGIIDASLTDGHQMEWGNREAIEGTFFSMVHRRGFGDVLARGMRVTADYLDAKIPSERRGGHSTYYYAQQVNNNPMFGLTDRLHSQALGYAIGRRSDLISDIDPYEMTLAMVDCEPRYSEEQKAASSARLREAAAALAGIDEAGDIFGYKGKATLVHDMGMTIGVADLCGTCKWHTKFNGLDVEPKDYVAALSAGLGRTVTTEELVAASLRMRDVERALECKLGRRRENDTIPERDFDKPMARGYWKGRPGVSRDRLEEMKSDYYTIRGWDLETGVPLKETLVEYGLDDIADDLAALGILPEGGSSGAGDEPPLAAILTKEDEARRGATGHSAVRS
ncbi:MAG: aldehyde ferredoxin oxidoreductase N-terminal domain-containing protein [Thermoleophilia bacterium]